MAEHSLSDSSLACVADLVRWYLPVRTLVQFKLVSKEWRTWCDENLLVLARQRRKDIASRDWYFPLAYEPVDMLRKWWGEHKWTQKQNTLPDLDFLPYWNVYPRQAYSIEAVSSGLLVMSKCMSLANSILLVCNPLSKEWRRLPIPTNCKDLGMYRRSYLAGSYYIRDQVGGIKARWEGIHTHLVVDDLSNEYKVIRISPKQCVNVYSSSTNGWVCSPHNLAKLLPYSSVCFNGCVYIMKLASTELDSWHYMLRIYDIESGEWLQTPVDITLNNFATRDSLMNSIELKELSRRPRDPILVECMGHLFAVSASCRSGYNEVDFSNFSTLCENHFVKTQFHIFKLTEGGRLLVGFIGNHVELPVEILRLHKDRALGIWDGCRHFSCVTRSNLICLAWSYGYHLEYDVVSGHRRTYTVPACRGTEIPGGHSMAYYPNLDVKP